MMRGPLLLPADHPADRSCSLRSIGYAIFLSPSGGRGNGSQGSSARDPPFPHLPISSSVVNRSLPFIALLLWLHPSSDLPAQTDPLPENLGPEINSSFTDFVPVISPDGGTLYFVRALTSENVGGARDEGDIWYSTRRPDGRWSQAVNIGAPLNDNGVNYVCSVTPDGNTLLLGRSTPKEKSLLMTHRTSTGWSRPAPLTIPEFYNRAEFAEYSLGSDGRTILLCVERDDSYGQKDIYVSFATEGGGEKSWSAPVNLGHTVNSAGAEISPFLAADGVTLYFSSDGRPGAGGVDIFVTRRLDDTWKRWSPPVSLGPTINTPGFDAYYTISAAGDYAYFVSTEMSYGEEDIFRIMLPRPAKPNPVLLVSGRVLEAETDRPVEAAIFYETLPEGKPAGTARTDPATGEYRIVLPAGSRYGFRAEASGYLAVNDNIDAREVAEFAEMKRDLLLAPIRIGQTIRLNNIFFDFARATLRMESSAELNRVVTFLTDNPGISIEIAGHTDNVGRDADNLRLSEERARSVAEYIASQGIPAARVASRGFGMTRPVASNDTEEGRQLNRRVEFTIMGN